MRSEDNNERGILYSCYHAKSREGEHFVADHVITYQISGTMEHSDGTRSIKSEPGTTLLYCRNQLMKFLKLPPDIGEFQSISVFLSQKMLRRFSMEYGLVAQHTVRKHSSIPVSTSPSLKIFFDSLIAYSRNDILGNAEFISLKQNELLMLILTSDPELKDVLFDFTDPHKIDLEAFMNQNYHFNVRVERFAYLTGRSLASFKRDFEKIFGTSPRKWLQHKRLQEAYYLVKDKGKTASEIYINLGFEDLSHFSFAFKKEFGVPPTKLLL